MDRTEKRIFREFVRQLQTKLVPFFGKPPESQIRTKPYADGHAWIIATRDYGHELWIRVGGPIPWWWLPLNSDKPVTYLDDGQILMVKWITVDNRPYQYTSIHDPRCEDIILKFYES